MAPREGHDTGGAGFAAVDAEEINYTSVEIQRFTAQGGSFISRGGRA